MWAGQVKSKVKQSLYRHITGTEGSRRLRFPDFLDCRHLKVIRLPVLRTGRLYPPPKEISLVLISAIGYVDPRIIMRPERLRKWKIANDTIGNQSRDLPACSTRSTSFSHLLFWFAVCMGRCLLAKQKNMFSWLAFWTAWSDGCERVSIAPLQRIILTPNLPCLRISIATVQCAI